MSAVTTSPGRPVQQTTEGLAILSPISWSQLMAIDAALGPDRTTRLTFIESRKHERLAELLGRLVELYLEEKQIEFFPFGSASLQQEIKQSQSQPPPTRFGYRPRAPLRSDALASASQSYL